MLINPSDRPRAAKRLWAARIAVVSGVGALLGLLTANPLLTVAGLLVLPVLFLLLWNLSEPPVLLFACTFQWAQVFVPVLRADARAEPLGHDIALVELQAAAWLGLVTVVALACGMRVGRGGGVLVSKDELKASVRELSPSRLMLAYLVGLSFSFLATGAGGIYPGVRQALLVVGLFRWLVAFLVLWAALNEGRFKRVALVVLGIEIALGFGGYFSSFKTVLFLAVIAVLGNEVKPIGFFRPRLILVYSVSLLLTMYWQAIKADYRVFLNQGTGSQVVLVSVSERILFLAEKTSTLTFSDLFDGLDQGLDRIGYLVYFAKVIDQVPEHIPFQSGRLWAEALTHVLTPRLLFPSKGSISDSERTTYFSGERVSGEETGSSISLGYAAESYIDFGPVGMCVPIFALGALWGVAFWWLVRCSANRLLGLAAATTVILTGAILFEASNVKILGGALTNILVLSVLLYFWSKQMWRLLRGR
jgi:hypothetical protein